MRFGVCSPLDRAPIVKAAGWDYIEAGVPEILQGTIVDEAAWTGDALLKQSPLPIRCAYLLVPAQMKIVGPEADLEALRQYLTRVVARAHRLGIPILGFGSGGARSIPDGFDRDRANEQLLNFCRAAADIAADAGIVIAMEPLNRPECNFINTIAEVAEIVRAVNRPAFRALLDTYHLWREDEPLENVAAALPYIAHVHVSDLDDRTPPGESGTSDYRPIFRLLKSADYDALISVESKWFDAESGTRSLQFLKRQWNEA
jgi:sugar phosphate isomerase/epimerase